MVPKLIWFFSTAANKQIPGRRDQSLRTEAGMSDVIQGQLRTKSHSKLIAIKCFLRTVTLKEETCTQCQIFSVEFWFSTRQQLSIVLTMIINYGDKLCIDLDLSQEMSRNMLNPFDFHSINVKGKDMLHVTSLD